MNTAKLKSYAPSADRDFIKADTARDSLKKKPAELAKLDEVLRHYADQRISIDLSGGVKINYGKFGKLLA